MMASVRSDLSLYLRLLEYVRPHWRAFAASVVAMAATAATEPLFPALIKPFLDNGFTGKLGYPVWLVPLAIIGVVLARGVFGFLAGYGMQWISHRVITDLRNDAFDRLIRLPTGFIDDIASGRLASKIAYDVGGVAVAATSALTVLVRDTLTLAGLVGWMLYLNWQLTLAAVLVFPPVALVTRTVGRRMRTLALGAQHAVGALMAALGEAIKGHKVVKIFGAHEYERKRFGQVTQSVRGYAMRMAVAQELQTPIVQLLVAVALAVVITIALVQADAQKTTVGGFMSFLTAMLMLLSPIKRLTDINAVLQRGLAAAESIFGLMDQPTEIDRGTRNLPRGTGHIVFDAVSFRYPGAERDALAGIDLDIAPGTSVALVGPSGGGKTTLVNLVPRFHAPTGGRILLDGIDLRELRLADLRANIALVSQEILLFNDTVAANIGYGRGSSVSRSQIEEAARAAHALDFIDELPHGFDSVIGEAGVKLSGGQRQRLAIARAILKDAPVLILDEATSALDSESERRVQAALDGLMRGRTTLVIAHRLSTIERADVIVVLDRGRIVERGTHAELLRHGATYAQLHRMQFTERRTST